MRTFFNPALFGIASLTTTLADLYEVSSGATAEWQVPLYAAGLTFASISTLICLIVLSLRGVRQALKRVRFRPIADVTDASMSSFDLPPVRR